MPELHETMMGKKLITSDIPKLITNIEKLGVVLELDSESKMIKIQSEKDIVYFSIDDNDYIRLKTDDYQVIKYLEVELNKKNLTEIINKINTSSNDVLRKNEIIYKNLDLRNINLSINKIVHMIISNPILLQRPIIAKYVNNKLAETLIGRPPEKILSILD